MTKEDILKEFSLFSLQTGGIGSWINEKTDPVILDRLAKIDREPLSQVQLTQLLVLGHEAPVSDVFFRYYWLSVPDRHPYQVEKLPGFDTKYADAKAITSLNHLTWGLHRLYVDGLLWFGNVRTAYRKFRSMAKGELEAYFIAKRFDTEKIKDRGPALPLATISKDDRYLISEMACKSYGDQSESRGDLKQALLKSFEAHVAKGGGAITIRKLLDGDFVKKEYEARQQEFIFSADDVLDEIVASESDLAGKYGRIAKQFVGARSAALANTRYYLSMVNDLDVYVATSMRGRQDFRSMAATCEAIFFDQKLKDLQLRYFDPTLSAASGHEDKGLIECLMVKCAKVLVYCAGEKESYGKDAEAAMALSLGKPVIFYCDQKQKSRFYKEVHPLSRLIDFSTGVAVGAIVTDSTSEVAELLHRIFENKMEYEMEQPKPGHLRLKERLTKSVVRLHTSDQLLAETFWNHYHNRPEGEQD
jgi:hypothetical protein